MLDSSHRESNTALKFWRFPAIPTLS